MEKERGITIIDVEREQAIGNIAWQVFQDRLRLRFKPSFTIEDKKKITDKSEYDYYREEATKIYEIRLMKKQRALSNKKYPVIEVPANGEKMWIGGAYTLCFVYSKYKGNFILKGYHNEVKDYLKKNYTHYFCNFSLWSNGFNRDIWSFWKDDVHIFEPENFRSKHIVNNKKYQVRAHSFHYLTDEENNKNKENGLSFKRLPKRWIPEFDRF